MAKTETPAVPSINLNGNGNKGTPTLIDKLKRTLGFKKDTHFNYILVTIKGIDT